MAQTNPTSVNVNLMDQSGENIGTASLTRAQTGVRIRVEASGLPPGEHGLHIHARGACDAPTFKSAGPHYQPNNRSHGFLDPDGPHAGDLPMLKVNARGRVKDYDFTTTHVSLSEDSLLNPEGTALIIHAQPDDYLKDTGGGTGDRIACGVISPVGGAQ